MMRLGKDGFLKEVTPVNFQRPAASEERKEGRKAFQTPRAWNRVKSSGNLKQLLEK